MKLLTRWTLDASPPAAWSHLLKTTCSISTCWREEEEGYNNDDDDDDDDADDDDNDDDNDEVCTDITYNEDVYSLSINLQQPLKTTGLLKAITTTA